MALEMILSGQYMAPTLNGEFYYEKPPLFNWILIGSFKLFGSYSLFALRFPVVLFVLLYAFAIFRLLRSHIGSKQAWLVAIATITCGRILFYDSFLGLMDIGLGALVFVQFMVFYHFGIQRRYLSLFLISYALTAIGYLLKGLPSVVFQFFSILAWAVYIRDWKFLFHRYNFLGLLLLIVPVAGYYALYLQANPGSLNTVVEYTIHQSSQRTVTDYGWLATLKAILRFPLDNLYHFAPWTLLLLLLFLPRHSKALWRDSFGRFAVLIVLLNIWVYWSSPGNQPRYLFMFLPFLFYMGISAYFRAGEFWRLLTERVFLVVMSILVLAPLAVFFLPENMDLPKGATGIALLLFLLLAVITALAWRHRAQRLVLLGCFLLVLRIGFNAYVLPFKSERGRQWAKGAVMAAEITKGNPLYVLKPDYCHDGTSFIISSMRGEILELRDEAEPGAYYLIDHVSFDPERFESILRFGTEGSDRDLHLARLLDQEPKPL